MAFKTASQLLSGAAFGMALTASGVWTPATISDTMHLRDFHMLQVFLAASGTSAFFIHLLAQTKYNTCPPRSPSSLGRLNKYDGNIIGGILLGFGMTLTGACPGTMLVQVVTGTYPGFYSFSGAVIGGIVYVAAGHFLRSPSSAVKVTAPKDLTIYGTLNVNVHGAVVAFEALCIGVLLALNTTTQSHPDDTINAFLPPVLGGLLIGTAQLTSLLLRGSPVGISTSYEEVGAAFWAFKNKLTARAKPEQQASVRPKPGTHSIIFSAGAMLGAFILVKQVPAFAKVAGSTTQVAISPWRALAGGITVVLGARTAGGCTSGHGISGMSMLSISSIITVASIFAGGMGLALFV